MADYIQILSNFGFPVAVACYLLFRFEKKLDDLETTTRDLVNKITLLIEKLSSKK